MGRLAGPIPIKTQRLRDWKHSTAAERQMLDERKGLPDKPIWRPPGQRRRMAFLKVLSEHYVDRPFYVGRKGWPPITSDMRWLIANGYLKLGRQTGHLSKSWSVLLPTNFGLKTVSQHGPNTEDTRWVWAAILHGVLE